MIVSNRDSPLCHFERKENEISALQVFGLCTCKKTKRKKFVLELLKSFNCGLEEFFQVVPTRKNYLGDFSIVD